MGPKSHATHRPFGLRQRQSSAAQKVHDNPVSQHQPRRQPENEKAPPREDSRSGIKDQISSHYAGNSASSSNGGNRRFKFEHQRRQACSQPAQREKGKIAEGAEPIFNVV